MRKPHRSFGLGPDIGALPVGCRPALRNYSSLVEVLPSGKTSGVIRIIQRTNGKIIGGLTIPREQFFDFMEAIIHCAATIEPYRGGKISRKSKLSRPASDRKRPDRSRFRRPSK